MSPAPICVSNTLAAFRPLFWNTMVRSWSPAKRPDLRGRLGFCRCREMRPASLRAVRRSSWRASGNGFRASLVRIVRGEKAGHTQANFFAHFADSSSCQHLSHFVPFTRHAHFIGVAVRRRNLRTMLNRFQQIDSVEAVRDFVNTTICGHYQPWLWKTCAIRFWWNGFTTRMRLKAVPSPSRKPD